MHLCSDLYEERDRNTEAERQRQRDVNLEKVQREFLSWLSGNESDEHP